MMFVNLRDTVPELHALSEVDSTNDWMARLNAQTPLLAHGTCAVTLNQKSGKGRLGRTWENEPGEGLAMSVLVRDFADSSLGVGWLPLIAGIAMAETLDPFLKTGYEALVKWPNDVYLVSTAERSAGEIGKKVVGILCQMLPDGEVIVGTGVNLFVPAERLAGERAGSLLASGADFSKILDATGHIDKNDEKALKIADQIAANFNTNLMKLIKEAHESPEKVRQKAHEHSHTVGRLVRAIMPDGQEITGVAENIAADGALNIRTEPNKLVTVLAGDVWHLREGER